MVNTNISKYISYLLRHCPEDGDLTLDKEGYCYTEDLVKAVEKKFGEFTLRDLEEIVATDEKKRYSFNNTHYMIRANQGHSTKQVDITFKAATPPDVLYHGTADRFYFSILEKGILPMNRQFVHLSKDEETARKVGKRHGKEVVLKVNCKEMVEDGYPFFISDNGVYLVPNVPPQYLIVEWYQWNGKFDFKFIEMEKKKNEK